jgi:hypothetical protein
MNPQEEKSNLEIDYKPISRRSLLPWWMKFFCWFFIVFGVLSTLNFALVFMSKQAIYLTSIYGLKGDPNLIGLVSMGVILFKVYVAYGLWFEKDWAIKYGMIDALIGIVICLLMTFLSPFLYGGNAIKFEFRIELVFLGMYAYKLESMDIEWDKRIIS